MSQPDYEAKYKALRKFLLKQSDIEYAEKVVYPYKSPAHQNWKVTLYIPDNLPKQHTLADLRSPRKPIEKAFDDFIEKLLD